MTYLMGRIKTAEAVRLDRWLEKMGFPHNVINWAFTPEVGKIPYECWQPYNGDINSLPRDRGLTFKREGGKTVIKIYLSSKTPTINAEGEEIEEEIGERREASSSALIPPELVSLQRELDERNNRIALKERELRDWEESLRTADIEIRKTTILSIKTGRELDDRTKAVAENLIHWNGYLTDKEVTAKRHLDDISERDRRINELSEKQAIVASVNLNLNKLANAYLMGKVKKFEDLPVAKVEDFQQYLLDRQQRQFFADMPDPVSDLGGMFTRLPDDNKPDFAEGIIRWTIATCPNMINDIAKAMAEEIKEARAAAESEE